MLGTLKIISFQDIVFGDRGRKLYEGIELLADSIRAKGLICPIAVYSPNGEAPFQLVAGGRRYKALQYLGATEVSARVFDSPLDPLELKILELWENTKRSDLTDAESVAMTKAINDAFISLKGEKVARSATAPGHSMRDTARMLNRSVGSVSEDIKLATAIEQFPELGLQNMRNKTSALTALKRLGTMVHAKLAGTQHIVHPLKDCYKVGDFFSNNLPSGGWGFLEVDPPYGMDLHENKRDVNAFTMGEYHEISKQDYPSFMDKLARECYRLAAPNAWMVLWQNIEWVMITRSILQDAGWTLSMMPAMWVKYINEVGRGQTNLPSTILGSATELFLYARKGEISLVKRGRCNVFHYPPVDPAHKIHPAEKPLALMEEIFDTFVWPGTPCLVPFAGSGTTLRVAHNRGHQVIGYDLSQAFKDTFVRSLV